MLKSLIKLILKLGQCLILSFVLLSDANASSSTSPDSSDEVIVELSSDYSKHYKERRAETGALVSINFEKIDLPKYISTLDNSLFSEKYGDLSLIGLQVQKKYNWSPVSMALGLGYTTGSAQGANEAIMEVTKYEINARAIIDGWFQEPRYAPFIFVEGWQMQISEKDSTTSFSGEIEGIGFHYGAGMSIQLNRIDPHASTDAFQEWGMENTYLDVYVSANIAPTNDAAPDVSSELAVGFGLTLEF